MRFRPRRPPPHDVAELDSDDEEAYGAPFPLNVSDRLPESLYHYTDAAGLLGILSTRKLWATDVHFLNDEQETTYAQGLFRDAVEAMSNPVLDPLHRLHGDEHAIHTFSRYKEYVVNELNLPRFGIYVTCFCESGDLLSQWRGYGSDHGYSVEFNSGTLVNSFDGLETYPPATGLYRVLYGNDAAKAILPNALDAVSAFNLNHPGVKAEYAALVLSSMLATVKHPGFAEEREWRMVASWGGIAPGHMADDRRAPLRFRATPMAIVPYLALPLLTDAIKAVRVGPGRYGDIRVTGVRKLLEALGLDASIVRSDVPLRG
jgi:hypothetical protein